MARRTVDVVSVLTRLRQRRLGLSSDRQEDGVAAPRDPTRPGAARIRDGIPIAHEGPPGFPGRPAVPGDADQPLTPLALRSVAMDDGTGRDGP